VAIDDASRLAYTELLPDEKKESAPAGLGSLGRALGRQFSPDRGFERIACRCGIELDPPGQCQEFRVRAAG